MEHDAVIEALIEGFTVEARDICQRVTSHLLELEHGGDLDEEVRGKRFEELARGLHTLKGNADTFGFPRLAELAHKMEDIVALYRPTLAEIPAAHADILLRSVDVFMARLAARNEDGDGGLGLLVDELSTAAAARDGDPVVASAPKPTATARPRETAATHTERTADDWRIGPRNIETLLREVERLRELRLRLEEQGRDIERTLRTVERREVLDPAELRAALVSLSRALVSNSQEANDIVDGLENELKTIATIPMYSVLDPLQRAVRDLGRTLGKEARLAVVGAEISLDRRVLEALKGSLVHLVRNAVDHGIETPERRIAAGKHREGSISIRIERSGNLVFIEVEDDGGGVDPDAIRATAVARGLLSPEDASAMEPRDLYQLVFRPGFSTRTEITETSGRGVGLDVVRAAVQAFGGHVELHTTLGSGSRFVLTMPAAIGATSVLVVRVDETTIGIPMVAIETIRAAKPEHLQTSRTASRYEHDGHLLPLVDLGAVLAVRAGVAVEAGQPILVVTYRGTRVALAVDELVGDRDLVVRPLPNELHDLLAYQGAAIQARGDLLLVVQPEFLVEGRLVAATSGDVARRALVVDDSLTARALHRTILESGGYQVHTVGSARQALDHLRHAYYDVLIADVMMPEVDGVQMTAMLRDRRETRELPIVLVSAHDAQPERERGLSAGADAFVSKKDCISGRLLGEVAAVIARRGRGR